MAKHLGNRRVALSAWLTDNGINPNDVPAHADMTIDDGPDGRTIRCEVYDRTTDGHIQPDDTGQKVASRFVTVPLLSDPPEWWEPRVKPTRDELLGVVARLRQLVGSDPDVTDENIDGWQHAMDAVEAVLDGKTT